MATETIKVKKEIAKIIEKNAFLQTFFELESFTRKAANTARDGKPLLHLLAKDTNGTLFFIKEKETLACTEWPSSSRRDLESLSKKINALALKTFVVDLCKRIKTKGGTFIIGTIFVPAPSWYLD